ncbi:hypothetical protein FGIG_10451, partial [Fasciola gigantica]
SKGVFEKRVGTSRQPYLLLTVLGWVLFGPSDILNCKEDFALAGQLSRTLALGELQPHNWYGNNDEVLSSIPLSNESPTPFISIDQGHRTLELFWHVIFNHFRFEMNLLWRPITRLGMLSCVASMFDPPCYVFPFLLIPKMLLQQLCRMICGWDDLANDALMFTLLLDRRGIANTGSPFKTFVANRVGFIHECIEVSQRSNAPTAMNPVDLASRSTSTTDFRRIILWRDSFGDLLLIA